MGMSNKEQLLWARALAQQKEFMKMDVGKAAEKTLKAIEVANGGAKKLAEADKVLSEARAKADALLASAEQQSAVWSSAAKVTIEVRERESVAQQENLLDQGTKMLIAEKALDGRMKDLADKASAQDARLIKLDDYEHRLIASAADVSRREVQVEQREAEVADKLRRFKEWAAA